MSDPRDVINKDAAWYEAEVARLKTALDEYEQDIFPRAERRFADAVARAEKAEAEVERMRTAISNVMTDDQLSTMVPAIGMTTREALRGEGKK